ncbi:MAG: hypothetical protein P8M18_10715 [Woeseiaceae bacterium]|nr:hypothetical protein [Woeseiaceae bacterium]
MKQIKTRLVILYFAGMFALALADSPAVGQENEPAPTESSQADGIEEITVYGEKNMIRLRTEFELAQTSLFVLFNAINTNDEFDVECDYERRLGSHRRHHVCTPKFATRQPAHAGSGFLFRNKQTGEVQSVTHRNIQLDKKLWDEMKLLLEENVQLRQAFLDLKSAKDAVDAEKKRRRNE